MTHAEAMQLHEARMDASRLRTALAMARDLLVPHLGEGSLQIREIDKRLGDLESLRNKGEWPYPGYELIGYACYAKNKDEAKPPATLMLCNIGDTGAFPVYREKELT